MTLIMGTCHQLLGENTALTRSRMWLCSFTYIDYTNRNIIVVDLVLLFFIDVSSPLLLEFVLIFKEFVLKTETACNSVFVFYLRIPPTYFDSWWILISCMHEIVYWVSCLVTLHWAMQETTSKRLLPLHNTEPLHKLRIYKPYIATRTLHWGLSWTCESCK